MKELIKFEDAEMRIRDANGERWLTCTDVAKSLGYAKTNSVQRLVDRSPQEFKGHEGVVTMTTPQGGVPDVRVLN